MCSKVVPLEGKGKSRIWVGGERGAVNCILHYRSDKVSASPLGSSRADTVY